MSIIDITQPISGTTTSSTRLEEDYNKRESQIPLLTSDELAVAAQTEQAVYNFYIQAKKIEGVEVTASGGDTWREKTIVVTVPDIFDKSTDEVFNLKLHIYDSYPLANLDVYVTESATGI